LLCNGKAVLKEKARAITEGMQTISPGVGKLEQGIITNVTVEGNGHKLLALLDSGAIFSVTTKGAIKISRPARSTETGHRTIQHCQRCHSNASGSVRARAFVGNTTFSMSYTVRDAHSYDVLVGTDFLNGAEALLD